MLLKGSQNIGFSNLSKSNPKEERQDFKPGVFVSLVAA
jgi:hypothetical protein